MNPIQYAIRPYQLCFQSDGRASKSEYWWFTLLNIICIIGLAVLAHVMKISIAFLWIYFVLQIVPSVNVGIRRLHDSNKSGWWILVGFIPAIGGLISLGLMCLSSTPGDNRYGPPAL